MTSVTKDKQEAAARPLEVSEVRLTPPSELKRQLVLSEKLQAQVNAHQEAIKAIVSGEDPRFLVVLGPCSLHCHDAAIEYGRLLARAQQACKDTCLLVMRAYLEKPRTTVGWKGMLYDPDLNGQDDMQKGIEQSRRLLLALLELGLPLATEALNPLAFQYVDDLISWAAVGARTTESQIHREMASKLRCAVGFKNGTDGSVGSAINALKASSQPHSYMATNQDGHISAIRAPGNRHGQLVLRGGNGRGNYDELSVSKASRAMKEAGLAPSIMIDCSHENSAKDYRKQSVVLESVLQQVAQHSHSAIKGIMLESHLREGRQVLKGELDYGVSVTDGCIGWRETEGLIARLAAALS